MLREGDSQDRRLLKRKVPVRKSMQRFSQCAGTSVNIAPTCARSPAALKVQRSTTASQRPQGTQSEPTALSCSRRWGRHSAEQIQNRLDTRGSAAINAPGRWGGWRSRRCARCWGASAPGPAPPPVPARRWRRRSARWCGGLPVFQKLAQLRLNWLNWGSTEAQLRLNWLNRLN